MFGYFYHEILRRTIIAFGTLFNGISIQHTDETKKVISVIQVPLAYGPTQKFIARLNQSPDLNKPVEITLPRMSFEFTGLSYDSSRKVTTTQYFVIKDPVNSTETKKAFMPVPYDMTFELSIMSKLNDDALQIVEQILPYFQPAYTLTVDLVDTLGEKKDIPITLETIAMEDNYEGDFSSRRVLIYTLRFTVKTYLFGPVSSASKDIIKKTTISYIAQSSTSNPVRELVYSVQPRAIQNYTGDILTNLSVDITESDITIQVNNASSITANTYLDIDGEEIFVKSIQGNSLNVERGKDGTKISSHLAGTAVKPITSTDNTLIPAGDNFGFDGSTI